MILITQGHENGVGLEVLLKSALLAPASWLPQFTLFAHRPTVERHIRKLGLPLQTTNDGVALPSGNLRCAWIRPVKAIPLSTVAMEEALLSCELVSAPILFTLPTTKDDLRNPARPQQRFLGHTEYLRARFGNAALGMFFTSDDLNVLLLTDHVALKDVTKELTAKAFREKLRCSLAALTRIEPDIKRVLVAGLNPHAGEGGLLGGEEKRLSAQLEKVRVEHHHHQVSGFYPGDTVLSQRKSNRDLLVYMHHDQGLAPFKALKGTLGANITLGLPFLRISVDHGTAFALYGKNSADYRGAYYCLRKAVTYREQLIGKDPGHEG